MNTPISSGICFIFRVRQMSSDLPGFPKRLPEKLKQIREQLGAEIVAFETDEDDMLISVLWGYARFSGNPLMNLMDDRLEVNWTNN